MRTNHSFKGEQHISRKNQGVSHLGVALKSVTSKSQFHLLSWKATSTCHPERRGAASKDLKLQPAKGAAIFSKTAREGFKALNQGQCHKPAGAQEQSSLGATGKY